MFNFEERDADERAWKHASLLARRRRAVERKAPSGSGGGPGIFDSDSVTPSKPSRASGDWRLGPLTPSSQGPRQEP